jgi:hypothetical protein
MNRTLKEATVRRFHYETHDQLRGHLTDFVNAYNFGRRLKTLKGLTPYEAICKSWTTEPERFTLNPLHQMPGLKHLISLSKQSVSWKMPYLPVAMKAVPDERPRRH